MTLCKKSSSCCRIYSQNCRLCSLCASINRYTVVIINPLTVALILSIVRVVVALKIKFVVACLRDNRELSSFLFFRSFNFSVVVLVRGWFFGDFENRHSLFRFIDSDEHYKLVNTLFFTHLHATVAKEISTTCRRRRVHAEDPGYRLLLFDEEHFSSLSSTFEVAWSDEK